MRQKRNGLGLCAAMGPCNPQATHTDGPVMMAALRLLGPMDCTRLSKRCLLTPKPTDLCHSAGPAFLSCVRFRRSSRLCSSPSLHVTNPRGPAALGRPWESPGVMPGGRGRFGRLGGLWAGNSAVATKMLRRGAAGVITALVASS